MNGGFGGPVAIPARLHPAPSGDNPPQMKETARRSFFATLIAVSVIVAVLALWKLRVLIALLFFAFIVAAAMRPGIEALKRRGVPRGIGIGIHYVVLAGLLALLLWLVVPRAADQVQAAVGTTSLRDEASQETGWRHDTLVELDGWLRDLPSTSNLVDHALDATRLGFEILIGIFFVFASAAYWIFERSRAVGLVLLLVPQEKRRVVRDTWDLIDLKLGAYVRGQLILIVAVATVLSMAFWAIGLPYWLLVGVFAGVVEIVPVIGPLTAGALAVGVGLTESWELALLAGLIVLVVRLTEDYLVIPKVLGEAVGLSPLLVLVSVTATALLFGEAAVLLAIPLAAVAATLVNVIVLDRDPAKEDVPTVLFPAQDAER
jgi:predicted PurR-regulated permease PerM